MFYNTVDFKDAVVLYNQFIELKQGDPAEVSKLKSSFFNYAKSRVEQGDLMAKDWLVRHNTISMLASQDLVDTSKAGSKGKQKRLETKLAASKDVTEEDLLSPGSSLPALIKEIESLIGLKGTKRQVFDLLNYGKLLTERRKAGLKTPSLSMHMAFLGNPGTGKTTMARKMAAIFYTMGLIRKDVLVEVDRTDLLGKRIGVTEEKTKEAFLSARGGILFIDEAHTLIQPYCELDFGHECSAVLTKLMEDYRDDVMVIFAGYEKEMKETILAHKGLKSRIAHHIQFDDYSTEEGIMIFEKFCLDNDYQVHSNGLQKIEAYLKSINHDGLGQNPNARDIRNIFEKSIIQQAQRLSALKKVTKNQLKQLLLEDIVLPAHVRKEKIIYLKS